jgi:diacylglycerol kinase (ATP)
MRIAPDASVSDGLLDVCVVGDIGRLTALGQVPGLYRGTHVHHPAVAMHRAASLDIDGNAVTSIHLDGEPFGTLPLRVRVEPGRLEVAALV